jgi:hypothetical protein
MLDGRRACFSIDSTLTLTITPDERPAWRGGVQGSQARPGIHSGHPCTLSCANCSPLDAADRLRPFRRDPSHASARKHPRTPERVTQNAEVSSDEDDELSPQSSLQARGSMYASDTPKTDEKKNKTAVDLTRE